MELSEQWIRQMWAEVLDASEVDKANTVLFVVTGEHDLSNVED